jgi:BlaI family penicillinase repressor
MHAPRFFLRGFRTARELTGPGLGPLERRVMDLLWEGREMSVHAVRDRFGPAVAYTTLMTTLDRLFKKGLLTRRKAGRAFIYAAATTRDTFEGRVAADVVAGLLGHHHDSPLPLLSHLVEAVGEQDARLLDELERLVQEKQGELRKRQAK